jgi:hypothetical protein
VKPFSDLMPLYTGYTIDAHHLIAEAPIPGWLVNVDGYVRDGRVTVFGMCDAHMFPGTDHFERFTCPSRAPAPVQERMRALADRVLTGMRYRCGFFNLEMFWDPGTGRLTLLELNPRLASQLAGLYRRVEGFNPHRMLLELCTGGEPRMARAEPGCGVAASLVSRRFDGRALEREPRRAELERVRRRAPDAAVMLYPKRGRALAREMKWLGSYRYAVMNLGAVDEAALERRYTEIRSILRFP